MTESSQREPDPPGEDLPENPTSDELDVEGPNESAPGHEPAADDGEQPGRAADEATD